MRSYNALGAQQGIMNASKTLLEYILYLKASGEMFPNIL